MTSQGPQYPDLAGKVVIVTGGASGIGEFIVRAFVRQGCKVGFIDLLEHEGRKLVDEFPSRPLRFARADLTDLDALHTAIDSLMRDLGPAEVLINNAARDERRSSDEVTPDFWDEQIAVNLRHQFFAAQAVLGGMKEMRRGSIVNFSSISWMTGRGGMAAYTASKAAVIGLTRSLARDYGPYNIRVNAISPGWILTDRQKALWIKPGDEDKLFEMQCLKRWLKPEEIAKFVVFLASEEASACTSQNYVVDGGWA